jgi:hypothetical protein
MRATNLKCPTGFPGELCLDPQFVNEPTGQGPNFTELQLDNFNFTPTSGSPAKGAGLSLPAVTIDFNGQVRTSPLTIGAQN